MPHKCKVHPDGETCKVPSSTMHGSKFVCAELDDDGKMCGNFIQWAQKEKNEQEMNDRRKVIAKYIIGQKWDSAEQVVQVLDELYVPKSLYGTKVNDYMAIRLLDTKL